jgi:glycosyltransferase involved in cell wall biosynthesis
MVITVVIPTYNRRESLAHCLESLFQQTYPHDQFEINIVVDGSTDSTLDYLRQLTFPCANQVLEQSNQGQASARNAGIRAAHGKYVLLIDDDFVCDSRLVEQHVNAHTASNLAVFGPILHDLSNASLPAIAIDREIGPFYARNREGNRPSAWLPPNSSLERELLLSCGGYDEQFGSAREDTELGLRLADRGVTFKYVPGAIVHQRYQKSADDLVREAALFGANDVRLLIKRPDYLAFSNLSRIDEGPVWKRLARRAVSAVSYSPEPLFAVLYRTLESLRQREPAIRVLNLRRYITWLRAAVREAGGWKSLMAQIEQARRSPRGQAA